MFRFKKSLLARVIFFAGYLIVLPVFAGAEQDIENTSREVLPACDETLWDFVYNPGRLEVKNPCIRVTGEVRSVRIAKDGDYHIGLRLDPAYRHLLNDANIRKQEGDLVLEPICQAVAIREHAQKSCKGFMKFMDIPEVGTRVAVWGAYVLDQYHGWMEIHPVTGIVPLAQ